MRQTRYDVVIVGSGSVGSTYARTLHEVNPSLRVLLVEAGPLIAEPPGRHVRTITDPAAFERARHIAARRLAAAKSGPLTRRSACAWRYG